MKALLLVAFAATTLAGCLDCQPMLEVRHCAEHQCQVPTDDAVFLNWTAEHAEAWPAVHAVMESTPKGDHHHETWTTQQEDDFWTHFGVSGDQPELFVRHDGDLFRIRVLACD